MDKIALFLKALNNFRKAAEELNRAWEECLQNGDEHVGNEQFPEPWESFDQTLYRIQIWQEAQAQQFKMPLEEQSVVKKICHCAHCLAIRGHK